MAGDGNYGGNGSIYWKNNHGGASTGGSDPTPVGNVGGGTGNFRVKLRYTTESGKSVGDLIKLVENLIGDATKALSKLQGGTTDVDVEARVPAISRKTAPTNGWEVRIDW